MTNPNIFWFATSINGRVVHVAAGCSPCYTVMVKTRRSFTNAIAMLLGWYSFKIDIGCQDAAFVEMASKYTMDLAVRASQEEAPQVDGATK